MAGVDEVGGVDLVPVGLGDAGILPSSAGLGVEPLRLGRVLGFAGGEHADVPQCLGFIAAAQQGDQCPEIFHDSYISSVPCIFPQDWRLPAAWVVKSSGAAAQW